MRVVRWLWEGSPVINGLLFASVLIGINSGIGIRLDPRVFVAIIAAIVLLYVAALFVFQAVCFALMTPERRRVRLRIFQTGYGRGGGWYVERAGQRLALLTDPRFEDMFWDSYAVEPLTEDVAERERILSDPSWWHQPGWCSVAGSSTAWPPRRSPPGTSSANRAGC